MDFGLALSNLFSPIVLAFALGLIATFLRSDLKFPNELYTAISIYLLLAIGLKGGYKLSISHLEDFIKPAVAALLLGTAIPLLAFSFLRKFSSLSLFDCAAIAAHYGSVSAVTFAGAQSFQDNLAANSLISQGTLGGVYEGYLPGLLAIMEVPAIIIGVFLAKVGGSLPILGHKKFKVTADTLGKESNSPNESLALKALFIELLAGKGSILLLGGMVIGFLGGKGGWAQVSPFFDLPFKGILTLFLLEAGLVTGRRIKDFKSVGIFLIGFGIVFPVLMGILGIWIGKISGLSVGGAMIFGTLAASASYIAAPAACRVAIPEANPTYSLTLSLAVTFPFNITVGIPLYHQISIILFQLG
ncbi:MAG: sodium-dependent bicarbonate transport family permease [Chloroherpetonaceae bacterium]|nr:sodium-dependent bicarbonate transport family permease [Chloroherpetonaceae bacterium]